METANPSPTVTNVTGAELRWYMQNHEESNYVLIDVRQGEEYLGGHIPGARLMPIAMCEANRAS